jgi:hypothetical protein
MGSFNLKEIQSGNVISGSIEKMADKAKRFMVKK